MGDFLLEIGTEEIPDWMIRLALESLRENYQSSQTGKLRGTIDLLDGTPRRLTLRVRGLDDRIADVEEVVAGPYVSAGEKAAQGFAKKQNTTVEALRRETDAKGQRYYAVVTHKGEVAAAVLSSVIPDVVARINWPKSMCWTGQGGIRFIRPIRWILALHNDEVVPFELAGVRSGNTTRGHRILGSKDPLPVTIGSYEQILRDNFVIVRADERRRKIEAGVAKSIQPDNELLETLVYLTEFPTPIRGSFDASYLELPKEILATVMRHHQHYFSVLNEDGSLAPQFVAVTNTDGDPEGLIRRGNERVLRARFNDARFFWQADQQKPLRDRVSDLQKVTFQARLGSYKDKTDRVVELASQLATQLGADVATTERAALLSKCDLTTEMVKEFTELQGVGGGLYAEAQREPKGVATAIYDHYKPVSMEDSIPRTLEGKVLSIADKLDTLRECFRIGLIPTGSKDPFALRRAAQGIIKILFEARLPLELSKFIDSDELSAFFRERMQFYLRDVLGYAYDEVSAVLAAPLTTLPDLADRADGIHFIRPTEDFEPLAASFKRIKNILKQAQVETAGQPDPALLKPGPEQDLHQAFLRVREITKKNGSYRENLASIASLRPQVDLFFDKILVNDPDPAIRQNRLALLYSLLTEFSTIADFSEIVTQGGGASA
ncbi:MAG: glycine--tRNA ligase subunit beta [Acidobacteriaceae bacterium]|nr:glycine--tRNA ligase subunit beta [Acidobacteriaceae bacterium]MBV9502348.1 glycine--tRNA ligase subunit beta [Acidobacteriaceae bacterium]